MDGLLVLDKPAGITSHDAVARMRRVLRERRIGHTGTLDPMATGVLALVIGRATRLARFISAADKTYEAIVQLGLRTDTADAGGRPAGPPWTGPLPARADIEAALVPFRGTFRQQPPAYSAKKIDGRRSYELARRQVDPVPSRLPEPVTVTVHDLQLQSVEDGRVTLTLTCSAGFYVRSLAHDIGEQLGVGAHLAALRRTRAGDYSLADTIPLATAESEPESARLALIPLDRLLTGLAAVVLTPEGVRYAEHGRDLGPAAWVQPAAPRTASPFVRLLGPSGELLGVAEPGNAPGILHPSVVLR